MFLLLKAAKIEPGYLSIDKLSFMLELSIHSECLNDLDHSNFEFLYSLQLSKYAVQPLYPDPYFNVAH